MNALETIISKTVRRPRYVKPHVKHPGLKQNDAVYAPMYATVYQVVWDASVWNPETKRDGDWCVQCAFHPFVEGKQDTSKVWYTWTSARAIEKAR